MANADASDRPILVVDDDIKILRLVRMYLEREGYRVIEASDGTSALAAISLQQPALVVLDVMLPEVDGLSVLKAVRRTDRRTPIVVLSALGRTDERITGLAAGADDYVPKPFSPAELVLRIKRVLERSSMSASATDDGPASDSILRHGDLTVDLARHEVHVGERLVDLTSIEFRLLAALLQADGRVLTRDRLLDVVYGEEGLDVLDRTIDVHIRRLRDKLGDDPDRPRYVATVRGAGYRAARLADEPAS